MKCASGSNLLEAIKPYNEIASKYHNLGKFVLVVQFIHCVVI